MDERERVSRGSLSFCILFIILFEAPFPHLYTPWLKSRARTRKKKIRQPLHKKRTTVSTTRFHLCLREIKQNINIEFRRQDT